MITPVYLRAIEKKVWHLQRELPWIKYTEDKVKNCFINFLQKVQIHLKIVTHLYTGDDAGLADFQCLPSTKPRVCTR